MTLAEASKIVYPLHEPHGRVRLTLVVGAQVRTFRVQPNDARKIIEALEAGVFCLPTGVASINGEPAARFGKDL